jgi:hypothetical protein
MQLPLKKVQWVEFHEHPISQSKNVKVELFEIYSKNLESSKERQQNFDHHLYCKLLLEKILRLNSVLVGHFLDYQCELLTRPYSWLTAMDMLLEYNVSLFLENNSAVKLNDALNLVNEKRTQYQQVPRLYRQDDFGNDNPYRFDSVKPQIDKLETYHAKKAFLLRMKTDYLQNQFKYDREDEVDFDVQIDLELTYLKAVQKMHKEKDFSLVAKPMVVTWELSQNILIDFFYQCLNKELPSGRKGISNSKKFIEQFLSTHFASPDGKLFSATSIRTIMTPSRFEKRPSAEDRIDLEEIIEKYEEGLNDKK